MSSKLDEDIIMEDCTYKNNSLYNFSSFNLPFYFRPRKRTYLDMLHNSNQIYLNNRIDNFKINNQILNDSSSLYSNNENKNDNSLIKNFDEFNILNRAKKNLQTKKKIEYDEEIERKWVENYYRIRNAELNKLRFGTG